MNNLILMFSISSQSLNVKLSLCTKKQKKPNVIRGRLDQALLKKRLDQLKFSESGLNFIHIIRRTKCIGKGSKWTFPFFKRSCIVAIEIISNGSSTSGLSASGLYFVYTMDLVIFFLWRKAERFRI